MWMQEFAILQPEFLFVIESLNRSVEFEFAVEIGGIMIALWETVLDSLLECVDVVMVFIIFHTKRLSKIVGKSTRQRAST